MSWREWIVRRAFPDVAAAIREATIAETLAEEDWGWRALTAQGAKDIPFQAWLEQLNDAVEAYRVNPLAYRIVELTVDHVLGKEVAVRCANSEWQDWVDRFWHDPLNRMPSRVHELLTELVLTGDLFVTFHPDPYGDMVYVRPIPSSLIDQIETNPEDIEDELRYHQLPQSVLGQRADLEGIWWDRERMRHYAINRLVGATRGQGDLAAILPWLRRYKDWLTDRVRINRFKGAFLWWVKLRTQDPRVIHRSGPSMPWRPTRARSWSPMRARSGRRSSRTSTLRRSSRMGRRCG